jgi:hypothetical protein
MKLFQLQELRTSRCATEFMRRNKCVEEMNSDCGKVHVFPGPGVSVACTVITITIATIIISVINTVPFNNHKLLM